MGQGLGDLVALMRCAKLSIGLPGAVAYGCRMLGALTRTYEGEVAPIVERVVSDLDERARVDCALRAMSTKIGMVMLSYARLAGCEERLEVAALAGAVTRLYDDLIDASTDTSLDDRLSDLFGDRPFTPDDDLEVLLGELVGEVRHRLEPRRGHGADAALNALHEYQCLSRRQRENSVPPAVLEKISRGKGAMAHLTLCSLVNPDMDAGEQDLVMALGEALQSLDDYMDVEQDDLNGVATLATLGITTLTDIGSRMSVLHDRVSARYGRPAARPYCGMIFFLLVKAVVGRRLPVLGRITRRLSGGSTALAFLVRGADAMAAAPATGRTR